MSSRSKIESGTLAFGLISIISSGCAAGISSTPHGLGAGQWNVSLPTAASYTQGLAYGRGGSSARAESVVDETLFAEARTAPLYGEETKKKPVARKRRAEQAQPAHNVPVTPVQEQTPSAPAPAKQERMELAASAPATSQLASADSSSEVGRYQAREAQSQTQQQFVAGDAIVIGASTLVVIILIVLLVLLLV